MSQEIEHMQLNKLRAEINFYNAQSQKLMAETRWYPLTVATVLIAGVAALTKLFF